MKQLRNQNGMIDLILIGVVFISAVTIGGYVYYQQQQIKKAQTTESNGVYVTSHPKSKTEGSQLSTTAALGSPTTSKTSTAPKTTKTITPSPAPPPSEPVALGPPPQNGTNCLPANASSYQQTVIGLSNTQYLQTNSWANTTKFYNALNFAGLLSTVNTKYTVVFALADFSFNNLSSSQLAFMNASPSNMRSVLGWQIITSCVVWSGYMQNDKLQMTLNTLNGPVTYLPSGIGEINNVPVAIWDWFTSNGAVHFTDKFIKPPN